MPSNIIETLDLNWLKQSTLAALTTRQTAKVLGLDVRTVSGAIQRGEPPSLRVGRRVLVPRLPLLKQLGAE